MQQQQQEQQALTDLLAQPQQTPKREYPLPSVVQWLLAQMATRPSLRQQLQAQGLLQAQLQARELVE